ncbi:transglycosylase SLT domain-containing protein [Nocardia thailandica]|uniref:Transglycosylase SLT domain-containing protein n=1 Tax=Nocardia thailandica TaxID=257275 RepID=A0ABW6PX64_9NOCA
MATYSAGSASVRIKPDFSGFIRQLRADLAEVEAKYGVEINPDMTGFAAALETRLGEIQARLGVEIFADMTGFATDLEARLGEIQAKLGVEIEPDTAGLETELQTELAGVDGKVEVEVGVSEDSLTRAEEKIRTRLGKISVEIRVSANTQPAAAEIAALRRLNRRFTMRVDAETNPAAREMEALRRLNRTHTMRVDADTSRAAAQMAALRAANAAASAGSGGGAGGSGLQLTALMNAAALGVGLLPAAASAIAEIGADVQSLLQNIVLIPGAFAAAGASFFTLSVGLDHLKDAFSDSPKKAAKAYAALSDEGKKTVDTLKSFGPAWDKIKDSVQDTTLSGLSLPLKDLLTTQQPVLRDGMTQLAGQFNGIFKTAIAEAGSDKSVGALRGIFGSTASAAGELNKAVVPIISTIRTLATSGSSVMPQLAASFATAATKADAFFAKASQSGDLSRWMQEGITAAGRLLSVLSNLGSSLSSIFRATKGDGDGFLLTMDKLTERMATWLKSSEGQAELRTFFAEGKQSLSEWKPVLESVGTIMGSLYSAAQQWSAILLPFLQAGASLLSSHNGMLQTILVSYFAFRTISPILSELQAAFGSATAAAGRFQTAFAAANTSASMLSRTGSGLAAMLGSGGMLGIAVAGAAIGLGLLAQKHQEAAAAASEQKRQLEQLRETLDDQTGAATEETRATVAKDLENKGVLKQAQALAIDPRQYVNAGLGLDEAAKAKINEKLTATILEQIPKTWESATYFDQTAGGLGLSRTDLAQAVQGIPEAVAKFEQAWAKNGNGLGGSLQDLAELKAALNEIGESAGTVGGELNGLDTTMGQAAEGQRRLYAALNGTFSLTDEGRQKFKDLGVEVLNVPNEKTVQVKTNSPEEIQRLRDLGYTVEALPDGTVKIILDDAAAKASIAALQAPGTKVITIEQRVQAGIDNPALREGAAPYSPESGYVHYASGGSITGGVAGRDSVPILGMPGEHMLTTSDVDKLGGQAGVYRFRAALQAGLVKPMATGGAVEWTDKNEIDLQQAQVAVTQAQEKLTKLENNPKASEADKEQARLKVQEAQLKAQELQNKKDGISTAPAPQAPLPGKVSAEELAIADAEDAVDQANAKRNQVYNDPASTDADKARADRDYQKAQNSLESTKTSKSGSSSSLPESYSAQGIGKAAGEIIATGILSFFGLENSVLSSTNTYNKAANTVYSYYNGTGSSSSGSSSTGTASSTTGGGYSYTPKETTTGTGTGTGTSSKSTTGESTESAGVERWRSTFASVLSALAMPSSWLSLGLAQMSTESGGNQWAQNNSDSNAANGTPSKGLMQVIDPTFARYRSSLYTNNIWDPSANIAAALLYTQARYGSPVGVWGKGQGYRSGGWVTGPGSTTSDSIFAPWLSDKEFVVSADAAAQHGPLLEAINAGQVPSLPAGFGAASSSSTSTSTASTTHDRSVNYWGDNYVMNPEELFRQQDRHVELQSLGPLAAFS